MIQKIKFIELSIRSMYKVKSVHKF